MHISTQTLRVALRSFTRHRGFTIVAALSLALAIALNTTMYGVLDAMISPALDIRDPGDVYALRIWRDARKSIDDATLASLIRGSLVDLEGTSYVEGDFSQEAVEYGRRFRMVSADIVAPNYFELLGVRLVSGRYFGSADMLAPTPSVVVSDRLAHALFLDGESPLGKVIEIDGGPHTVIGVRRSTGPSDADLWKLVPRDVNLSALPISVLRLRPGVPREQLDAQLALAAQRLALVSRDDPKNVRLQLTAVTSSQFRVKGFHLALIGSVLAVLLIACANLANLQLAHGIGRTRELAVRAALGASRGDLVAQLLVESAMLAGAGLALGLVATFWAADLLRWHIPSQVATYVVAPQTSWRVFVFAIAACAVCVFIIGLVPAMRISRVDPNELLKAGAGTGASTKHRRQYGVMVTAQIALSLALLSATSVIVHDAVRLSAEKPGMDVDALSQASVLLRPSRDTAFDLADEFQRVAGALRSARGVSDVTVTSSQQVVGHAISSFAANGTVQETRAPVYTYRVVSPSYFKVYGWRVAAGRDFVYGVSNESEVIVDKSTARKLWPGVNPVGARIKLGADSARIPWVRVVGVVSDLPNLHTFLTSAPLENRTAGLGNIYYRPGARDSVRFKAHVPRFAYTVVARASSDPNRLPITLRRALLPVAPGAVIWAVTMDEATGIAEMRQGQDFIAAMFLLFTTLALGLAAFGVYGIVAHSVAERRRELGVRVALGASSRNIVGLVLREGNAFALAGIALGLWITKDSIWYLRAFSIEDDAYNAPLFAAMALVLFATVLGAALVPALRATHIDPVESLRNE